MQVLFQISIVILHQKLLKQDGKLLREIPSLRSILMSSVYLSLKYSTAALVVLIMFPK